MKVCDTQTFIKIHELFFREIKVWWFVFFIVFHHPAPSPPPVYLQIVFNIFCLIPSDNLDLGEGAPVSTSDRPDPPGSPGSSGRRHQQRLHAPHQPRDEPRPDPRPLPNTVPPRCSAPPRPRACQDLPPTNPICPLLTRWTRAEPLLLRSRTKPRASPEPGRGAEEPRSRVGARAPSMHLGNRTSTPPPPPPPPHVD